MVQHTDLSLNIRQPGVSTAQAVSALGRLGSRYALVQDDVGRANVLAAAVYTVVFRSYWPKDLPGHRDGDDNLHTKVTPESWTRHMQSLGLAPEVYWYCGNEPVAEYEKLVEFTLECMQRAKYLGRRLVVGNFSTGMPAEEDWYDILAPLLDALQDGWHALGLHEYIVTSYEVSKDYHPGRFQWMLKACDRLGYTTPRIWITEHGYDLTGSWQSLGLSAAQFAAGVGRCLRELYGPFRVEAVFLFCLGPWASGQGWQFDVAPALDELAKVAGEGVMPLDLTNLESGFIEPEAQGAGINIRNAPAGETIGAMAGMNHCQRTVEAVVKKLGTDTYTWRWYSFDDPDLPDGYMADEVLHWGKDAVPEPEPEPQPEPEPTPSPGTLTQEQALALMNSFITMGDQLIAAVKQWQALCIETRDEIAANLVIAPRPPEQEALHEEKAA